MSRSRQPVDLAIDRDALVDDLIALVGCRSLGGAERDALELVAAMADRLGLAARLDEEDLAELRRSPGYPGEEVERDRLHTLTVTAPGGRSGAPRLVFNGHIDVVPPGTRVWTSPPFTPVLRDDRLYGRGAADMKGGVVAALHALAALRAVPSGPPGEVVLHVVAGEEDGGVGAFAALRRDADFAGCVIPEPTAGDVVCATAGALTFRVRLRGVAAHASFRRSGTSAVERFWPVHRALTELERRLNAGVTHPLMAELDLPYPLSVGTLAAGQWSSTVPDELVCEGRVGVPVGDTVESVRARFDEAVYEASAGTGEPAEVTWTGGQFAPGQTPVDDPLVALVRDVAAEVTGRPVRPVGVPYGADLRQYTARGIPTVLYGPGDIARAHAVDEYVPVERVVSCARVLARVAARFGRVGLTSDGT